MDTLMTVLSFILPVLTGVVGWFAGGKKRKNDFLHELQSSVDMLLEKNKTLLMEVINLRGENADQKKQLNEMQFNLETLRRENEHLTMAFNNLMNKIKCLTGNNEIAL
jgi:FtsZ-binding cell division protein ZapB